MIRHLIRLAWNKKGSNSLLMIEIFTAFLVTFAVTALALVLWNNHRQPLGFEWQNVYAISLEIGDGDSDDAEWLENQQETFQRVLQEATGFDEVEAAAGVHNLPFEVGGSTRSWDNLEMQLNEVTDGYIDVMRLELIAGRWFGPEDEGSSRLSVVIDRDLAREYFGDRDPVDQILSGESGEDEYRVIGVLSDYREDGELSPRTNYLFERKVFDASERPPSTVVVRVGGSTPVEFEERVVERLQSVAPDWSFEIRDLAGMRQSTMRLRLAPLLIGSVVGAFLLIMVGLGLIGVLWQNVTQRTQELGLRRAVGADRRRIYRQILAELALMTTAGLLVGVVVVVQLPFLDLVGSISNTLFVMAILLSTLMMYSLTLLCGLYPSWLATRVEVAEALRCD